MKKGFTLIELLVVISIIGILAGLTLTGFNAARKNARDTQRKSDLAQYRSALEAYASNNNGKYPKSCAWGSECGHGETPNQSGIFQNNGPLIPNYLPTTIHDPAEGAGVEGTACGVPGAGCQYRSRMRDDQSGYVLEAYLETGGVWQICSEGKAGKISVDPDYNGYCDLP